MWKTHPKFYIGFNREKSRNFPKSLWRLKYWILRSETWTQSSLGSKMGGRSKNVYPTSNIKGGMAQNVQNPHFDAFDHKIHNIWARIKIFGPIPMFSTPRISLGLKTLEVYRYHILPIPILPILSRTDTDTTDTDTDTRNIFYTFRAFSGFLNFENRSIQSKVIDTFRYCNRK